MNKGKLLLHPGPKDVSIDQILNIDSPQYIIGGYIAFKLQVNKQNCRKAKHSSRALLDIFKNDVEIKTSWGKGCFNNSCRKFKLSLLNFTGYHITPLFQAPLKNRPFRKFSDLTKWRPDLRANKQSCIARLIENFSA